MFPPKQEEKKYDVIKLWSKGIFCSCAIMLKPLPLPSQRKARHLCVLMEISWTKGNYSLTILLILFKLYVRLEIIYTLYRLPILASDLKSLWLHITLLLYCFPKKVMILLINCRLILFGAYVVLRDSGRTEYCNHSAHLSVA